jgi:hypothetical protein
MNVTTTARVVGAAALGTLVAVVPAASAHAGPVSNGCPAGYTSYTVDYLESVGPYEVPRRMDEEFGSHGLAPNHNGSVCAVKLGNLTAGGYQIYNFIDDSLPASSKS